MGVRLASVASTVILGSVPANGAETAICTTPPINLTLDGAQVLLYWLLVQTIGTGTTSVAIKLRRGSGIAGTLVNLGGNIAVTAGVGSGLAGCYPDIPGTVAGQQYTLTCSAIATTGVHTTFDVSLVAMVL